MKKDRTSSLLGAVRILKAAFDLQWLHFDYTEWITKRDRIIIEICYDNYVRILLPCLNDYQKGLLTSDEQRMIAKAIKIIAEDGDFFLKPWDRPEYTLNTPSKNILEHLNNCREAIRRFIKALKITDIASLAEVAGDFIKTLSPESQIFDNCILIKIQNPVSDSYKRVEVYEIEIIGKKDRIEVSPDVSGSFNYLFESKINIETGEVLKTRYDLVNYTIDISDIIDSC